MPRPPITAALLLWLAGAGASSLTGQAATSASDRADSLFAAGELAAADSAFLVRSATADAPAPHHSGRLRDRHT